MFISLCDPTSDLWSRKTSGLLRDHPTTWPQATHSSPSGRPSHLPLRPLLLQSCHYLVHEPPRDFATCIGLHSYKGEELEPGPVTGFSVQGEAGRSREGTGFASAQHWNHSGRHRAKTPTCLNLSALIWQVGMWTRHRLPVLLPGLVHRIPALWNRYMGISGLRNNLTR